MVIMDMGMIIAIAWCLEINKTLFLKTGPNCIN